METTIEYNEKFFLTELEGSLKEMKEKRKSHNDHLTQPSWRDLFNIDKE